jgi:hypothetical protein
LDEPLDIRYSKRFIHEDPGLKQSVINVKYFLIKKDYTAKKTRREGRVCGGDVLLSAQIKLDLYLLFQRRIATVSVR